MTDTRRALYERRMTRVIDHIHDNPDGDLSLDRLAEVAGLSRFHFHRIYVAMTGETVAATARRMRLHRAAGLLLETDATVETIARRCGYTNRRSFAHAFRAAFGESPAAFRTGGGPLPAAGLRSTGETEMHPIEIIDTPARRLAAVGHRGPYPEIGRAFERLWAVVASHALMPAVRGMAAVYHDDPEAVEAAALRAHAGVLVATDTALPEGLEDVRLPGGRHAVMHFTGPYAGLGQAYRHLYGSWLPGSGQEPRDAPAYEIYLDDPRTTGPTACRTDIHLPLA